MGRGHQLDQAYRAGSQRYRTLPERVGQTFEPQWWRHTGRGYPTTGEVQTDLVPVEDIQQLPSPRGGQNRQRACRLGCVLACEPVYMRALPVGSLPPSPCFPNSTTTSTPPSSSGRRTGYSRWVRPT